MLVQWFFSPIPARHLEFVECLKRNVLNRHLTHIHFLQSRTGPAGVPWSLASFEGIMRDPDFPGAQFAQKLVLSTHAFEDRLPASVALDYASKHLKRRHCVFANLDIFFDDTLGKLKNPAIDLNFMNFYFLSRYEFREAGTEAGGLEVVHPEAKKEEAKEEDGEDFMQMREVLTPEGMTVIQHRGLEDQCGPNYIGSHDAIVFVPPVPVELVGRCDVEIGSWGIENRLMWEFERFGIRVRNPCVDIKSWHLHRSLLKASWTPLVNGDNRSSVAHPQKLFPSPFPRMRVDLQRGVLAPRSLFAGAVVMLRNEHSVRCLFSRSDSKFGHARCTEDYVDQHWVIQEVKQQQQQPGFFGTPPGLVETISEAFVFQGRESRQCLACTETWIGHQPCLLAGEVSDHLLWRLVSLRPRTRAALPDLLLVSEKYHRCAFSAITDDLGMLGCQDGVTEHMVWKLDQLHLV